MTIITRETLGLAALAAGRRITIAPTGHDTFVAIDADSRHIWRPNFDIADAARLADLLGMRVSHPMHVGDGVLVEADGVVPMTVYRSDRMRQYCEAITLCAAQIGKRMREGGR